jgi:hypothetical protein
MGDPHPHCRAEMAGVAVTVVLGAPPKKGKGSLLLRPDSKETNGRVDRGRQPTPLKEKQKSQLGSGAKRSHGV